MKRSLLLINQAAGYLMLDICNAFVESGKYDRVALQTGEINIRPTRPHPLLKIERSKCYSKRSLFTRILSWSLSLLHSLFLIWFRYRKADLFLVSNPPLNILLPKLCRNSYSLLIYDIYPDVLVAQGICSAESWIVRRWRRLNKQVMAKAQHLYTISEAMAETLAGYTPRERIEVIEIWSHNEMFRAIPKSDNPFLRMHGLTDKFIVQYSGNMGYTHDVDVLADVAARLRHRDDIFFLFIGEGAKKRTIQQKISEEQLDNCKMLPFQSAEILPFSMGAADVGVITLDSKSGSLSIPSKTYTYLAIGSAILSVADENSQLARLVREKSLGASFPKTQVENIARYIEFLADNETERIALRDNNRAYAHNFQPANALKYVR